MERIESLPLPAPDLDEAGMRQYLLDVSNWVKRIEERLTEYPKTYSQSLTPTVSVAANSTGTEAFTVTGITSGDNLTITQDATAGNVFAISAVASADDTITVTFMNTTGGALTPATGTYKFISVEGDN